MPAWRLVGSTLATNSFTLRDDTTPDLGMFMFICKCCYFFNTIWYQYDTTHLIIYFMCSSGLCNVSLGWRCWRSAWKCQLLESKRPRWVRTQQPAVPAMACHLTSCDVPMGDNMRWLHNMFCHRPCLYSIVSASAFALLSLRCEYKIRGMHEIQLQLACAYHVLYSHMLYSIFFATNPITIPWNKS